MNFIINHDKKAPSPALSQLKLLAKIGYSLIFLIYMTSCSTKTSQQIEQQVKKTSTEVAQPTQLSAQQLIELAKTQNENHAIDTLLSAINQYFLEQRPIKAIWLAHQLETLTLTPQHQYLVALAKTKGFVQLSMTDKANDGLDSLTALERQYNIPPTLESFLLKQQLAEIKQQTVPAINAQLNAFVIDQSASHETVEDIWLKLSKLANWQVEQLSLLNPPLFNGWQSLLSYCHQFGHDNAALIRYIQLWQRNFPTHPGNHVAKQLIANAQTTLTPVIKNIAVILPLSGKQELAGLVAQEGLLAAYRNNDALTLHFIDSNQWQIDDLATQFEELAIDYVIGPLLKENVEAYIDRDDILIPTLLLNTVNGTTLKEHQVAFSMRPEDEAIQAASTLSAKQFKHPLILSHKDNVSQRIAQQFASTWQKLNEHPPELIYFERGNNMEKILKESLEVDKSQSRINDLDIRVKQVLKTETRNRRDIDMIYLIGSASETRLLKPYIDVNISPFAKTIPVYASSRSHSGQFDESDSRDLAGLTFTEMPWLLPSQHQNQTLAKLTKKLWPQRGDSLQRIFAMGYDSLELIHKVEAMKSAPYIRHYGQTGVLQLNPEHLLIRSLLWGEYNRDGIESVALVK